MANKIQVLGPYSLSRTSRDLLFISGQLGINPKTGHLDNEFRKQCINSLMNIQQILEDANLDLSNIIKLTVFMSDLENFDELNKIFEEYFETPFPSRSVLEVSKLPKEGLLEIEAIAQINDCQK